MSKSLKVDPGEMRRLVEYQSYEVVDRDRNGGEIREWATQFTAYAAVRPLSAKELFYAGGQQGQTQYRIFMRYRPGVAQEGRLRLWDGRLLDITSVINTDERNVYLDIVAVQIGG